jgi:hypothetical protein
MSFRAVGYSKAWMIVLPLVLLGTAASIHAQEDDPSLPSCPMYRGANLEYYRVANDVHLEDWLKTDPFKRLPDAIGFIGDGNPASGETGSRSPDNANDTFLEAPIPSGGGYALRLRGTFRAPTHTWYTFYLSAGSPARLEIYDDPSNRNDYNTFTATVPSPTALREWDKFQSQHTAPIELGVGQQLYYEIVMKAEGTNNHLSLGMVNYVSYTEPPPLPAQPMEGSLSVPEVPCYSRLRGKIVDANSAPVHDLGITLGLNGRLYRAQTDANGSFDLLVEGWGDARLYVWSSDPSEEFQINPTVVKLEPHQILRQTFTASVQPLRTMTLDGSNALWKAYKRGGTPFDSAILAPDYDDSDWAAVEPGKPFIPPAGEPALGSWWERVHFTLPDDFPTERYAILHGFTANNSLVGLWVNGVALGASASGSEKSYLVPPSTLKQGPGNILVVRRGNGDGEMDVGSAFRITTGSLTEGVLKLHASGVSPERGGGQGFVATLMDTTGNPVNEAGTDPMGIADIGPLPTGQYTLKVEPMFQNDLSVQIAAGQMTETSFYTQPAFSLSTAYWNLDGVWKAREGVNPGDLSPAFETYDDTKPPWIPLIAQPLDLRDPLQPPEIKNALDELTDGWIRFTFNLPSDILTRNQCGDLILDDFNIEDSDITFFNGQEIGRTDESGERSYRIPYRLPRYGEGQDNRNVLAFLIHSETGRFGFTDRSRSLRLRIADHTAFPLSPPPTCGDITGDDGINIKDAILLLRIISGQVPPSDPAEMKADFNRDGRLDIRDAITMLRIVVYHIPWPYECGNRCE